MATKEPEQSSPERKKATSSSKKRKSAVPEIEVDLSLPEPPSKKARRLLRKGKTLPAKPTSDDEDDSKTPEDGKAGAVKDGKTKKERSPHGVWIGNLRFTVTKAELRKWLVENSGGVITEESITRVHMPATKTAAGPGPKKANPENRGFAYVDFSSFEANVAAIALSETEWNGRKLLIKDSKNFEGRPKKEEPEAATADGTGKGAASSGAKDAPASQGCTKIFVGNLSFNTTEDDLRAHFERCGKIRWVKVAAFEDSGKCKGYGWVNFEDAEAAAWAVKGFVKVRETVETLEDFMDEDSKPAEEAAAAAADGEANPSSAENDDGDDEADEGEDSTTKNKKRAATTKEPPRTRTRKWWVNQLLGRNLKIELAEDDQTRYHKRFGKGAAKRQQQQQDDGSSNNGRRQPTQEDGSTNRGVKKEEGKKDIAYHTDISVARLTGAPVAHQGKKVTFD
ncbi:RNA-binding domain-containing protein [Parathielavia hyrcaniae]|uniref:RNA-binding domain-containing protein n=1 Tax=Parathielavia hyrcaniae TaxID=113614 RepID=A0AAN6T5A5_9PEZI|nr:RNA-binding domain-containing protein [Parathielavia hyrcaniae]